MKYKIKEDWSKCTVDDLIELMKNGSSAKQYNEKVGFPITRIETISAETIDLERVKYIEENDDELLEKHSLKRGDILLSHINSDSHLGKTAIYKNQTETLIHGINLLLLRPCPHVEPDFLNYQFKHLRSKGKFIEVAQRAVNQSSINQRKLKTFDLELPPAPIQRAIVAKIEELFSSLDSGIADLKKAQEQLKIYKQAILKKAFEGKLIQNCSAPQRIKLGSVIEKPKYGTSKKCSTEQKGMPVLRIPNIDNGGISTEELKYASFDEKELESLSLKEGDILTIRSNGSIDLVGKCALITKKDVDFLYAGYLIRLRPDNKLINSKFLLFCMLSHELRVQIESKAKSTSGVNNINSGELQGLEIPIFPLNQQEKIVKQIEVQFSICDNVLNDVTQLMESSEALRQSILKKAFEGNLLSEEEIGKAKKEHDYEPAEVLLQKIRAEKKKK